MKGVATAGKAEYGDRDAGGVVCGVAMVVRVVVPDGNGEGSGACNGDGCGDANLAVEHVCDG